jgi:hypothetical protein
VVRAAQAATTRGELEQLTQEVRRMRSLLESLEDAQREQRARLEQEER